MAQINSSALSSVFASLNSNVSSINQQSADLAHQQERKTARTFEDVEAEFPGLGLYLQALRSQALIASGLMTADHLPAAGLSDMDRWNLYNGSMVVDKAPNGAVVRRADGKVSRHFVPGVRSAVFGIFRAAMSKSVERNEDGSTRPIYSGTFTLPSFNDDSADAPYAGKKMTRTEVGAIIKEFGSQWDEHPVVAAISEFGKRLDASKREREAENINRNASRHHMAASPAALASDRDIATHRHSSAPITTSLKTLLSSVEPTVVTVEASEAPAAQGASADALAEIEAMNTSKSARKSRKVAKQAE